MDECRILPCIRKDNRVLGVACKIGGVGADFLHIVAAKGQVDNRLPVTVPVKGKHFKQAVGGDFRAICGGQPFRRVETEAHVSDFTVHPHAVGFICLKALYKVNLHTLTLIVEVRGCFRDGDFLPCVDKLNGVCLAIQYEAKRSGDFLYLIFPKVKLPGLRRAVRTCGNGVNHFALGRSESAVQSVNVLGGGNLIDRTLKTCHGENRLVQPLSARDGAEYLARLPYGDSAFLCGVGAYHLDDGDAAFFLGVLLHHVKIDWLGV